MWVKYSLLNLLSLHPPNLHHPIPVYHNLRPGKHTSPCQSCVTIFIFSGKYFYCFSLKYVLYLHTVIYEPSPACFPPSSAGEFLSTALYFFDLVKLFSINYAVLFNCIDQQKFEQWKTWFTHILESLGILHLTILHPIVC